MSTPTYPGAGRASAMRLLLEPELMEGDASRLMTDAREPDEPFLIDQTPPGVLAKWERTREDLNELMGWRAHDLRWQVVHRLRMMNVNHGIQAWQLRYSKPLSAYAVAFVFTQSAGPGNHLQTTIVQAATRLWKAGPESRYPVPLLSSMLDQIRGRDPRLPWDMRDELANRCDDEMTTDAVYTGLGLSTLNTNTGTFAEVCQHARNESDIPGGFLYLSTGSDDPEDQQVIVADRRAATDQNLTTIHSYRALSHFRRSSPYPFAEPGLRELYNEFGHGSVLRCMWALDRALHEADVARRATFPEPPTSHRGRS